MSPYLFLYFFLLFITLFVYQRKQSEGIALLFVMALFVFAAIRYDIGRDYDTYLDVFNNPNEIGTSEKGYMYINSLIKKLGFSFQTVIILFSGLTILFAYLYINENSSDKVLSLFIFFSYSPFYLGSLNTIRQALAIYVFLYSVKFIKEKKIFHYTFVILLLSFFAHKSSIILIPLYFILNKEWKSAFKILLLLFSIILSKSLDIIIKNTPYAHYLAGGASSGSISPVYIFDIFICFISTYLLRKGNNKVFYNLSFISLCVLLLGIFLQNSPIFVLVARINEYFLPSIIVLVPEIIKKMKNKKIMYLFFTTCFSGIYLLSIVVNGVTNQNVPFKTYFNVYGIHWFYDFVFILFLIIVYLSIIDKHILRIRNSNVKIGRGL